MAATHWPGWDFEALSASTVERLETGTVWATLKETLAEFDVFCDLPYAFLYEEALTAYPDAKFLLIRRDVRRWIAAVRRHIGQRSLSNYEKFQYWNYLKDRCDLISDYTDAELEAAYLRHLVRVTNFMSKKGGPFRIFWLSDRELGRHCADYLGFAQTHDFPSIDYLRSKQDRSSTAVG